METKETEKHIICFHLLNNYSGSPFVLSQIIDVLKIKGHKITLYTSNSIGFLSNIPQIESFKLWYKWKSNIIILTFLLLFTQIQLFFTVLFKYPFNKNQIFYINTILPFGAALAGWLFRIKIIYHVHEFYIKPNVVQKFSLYVMRLTANKIIFVSNYLQKESQVRQDFLILPNTLPFQFINIADSFLKNKKINKRLLKNILMVSSLKTYKGVLIFTDLAAKMPEFDFCLVVDASETEVLNFTKKYKTSKNLSVFSSQSNIHPFYQKADLLLNLTIQSYCIETFGLTILEGMTYGLPSIVPQVGGPVELVEDGYNGFLVDARNIDELLEKIKILMNDVKLYNRFSENALLKSKQFDYKEMINQIDEFIS